MRSQVDSLSAADFMGEFSVDLATLKDHAVVRKWFALENPTGKKADVSGHVETAAFRFQIPLKIETG